MTQRISLGNGIPVLPLGNRFCKICSQEKSPDDFYFYITKKGEHKRTGTTCKECRNKQHVKWTKNNVDTLRELKNEKWFILKWRMFLHRARGRAKKKGLPYNIDLEDVIPPTHCPVLGIELDWSALKTQDNCPSLDRIIPSLGYVKGNVIVVSILANRIKTNATIEQIGKVYEFYDRLINKDKQDDQSKS